MISSQFAHNAHRMLVIVQTSLVSSQMCRSQFTNVINIYMTCVDVSSHAL